MNGNFDFFVKNGVHLQIVHLKKDSSQKNKKNRPKSAEKKKVLYRVGENGQKMPILRGIFFSKMTYFCDFSTFVKKSSSSI